MMTTAKFWKDLAERAVKTFAQAELATLTIGTAITDVDWKAGLGVAATAALISVLTSIMSATVGDGESASLVTGDDRA